MKSANAPVNWLRAFEVAARHLSLSAAARELHVTPAAVSQQVRLLEHRVGVPLFVRHSRGLRLTRAGEALVPVCRESFGRLNFALAELFGWPGRHQLVVRVALGFARHWLLDKLAAFSTRHPNLQIRVLASVWAGEPVDDTVDIDLRIGTGPVPGKETHQLTHDGIFPVCSPALLESGPRVRQPKDLLAYPLLATVGFAESWPHWMRAANQELDPPAPRLEFDSMRLALEMAAQGYGIALARTSYAADLLASRKLKRLFKVRLAASDNLYLTCANGLDEREPAALFRDWLTSGPKLRNRR